MPVSPTSRTDRILAIAAVSIALAAALSSFYQASISRAQQRASAWPYLMQSNSLVAGQPYSRIVENAGVGPARVRAFEVRVDGVPRRDWNAVVEALAGEPEPDLVYSSFGPGTVLAAGASRTVLMLPSGPHAARFWQEAQERLTTRACYCSVYGECWVADSEQDEPEEVGACRPDPSAAFQK